MSDVLAIKVELRNSVSLRIFELTDFGLDFGIEIGRFRLLCSTLVHAPCVYHPSPPKRTSPRSRRHSSSSPQDLIHLIPCLLPNSGDEAQPALLGKHDNPLGGMLEKAPPTPAAHTLARPMDPRPLRPPLRAPPLRDRRAFLGLNAGVFPFLYFTFLPITNYILYT